MCRTIHEQGGTESEWSFFINDKIIHLQHILSLRLPVSGCFRCVIYDFLWLIYLTLSRTLARDVVLKFTHTRSLSLLIRKIN